MTLDTVNAWLSQLSSIVWGPLMLVFILGAGVYLTVILRAYPLTHIAKGFKLLFHGTHGKGKGDISPFNALKTSLSATIGTGNIAGVATALFFGGPGALFWMWCTALVGMATKYAEAVCAVHFRERDEAGNYSGGPMYYIKNGLGHRWRWLAMCFAIFGALAGFGIGDGVLVPFMAVAYMLAGLSIIIVHADQIPAVLSLVVASAFSGEAAAGGVAGSAMMLAIRWGVARGIFSNEAGLGSAPIAHAAAQTNSPVRHVY